MDDAVAPPPDLVAPPDLIAPPDLTAAADDPAEARVVRFAQTGTASWYGRRFHHRRTASGERFDMNGLTAAHRWLPLGTRVRVTNLENGRVVVVRINDRGPYVHGRVIDLSAKAARVLRMKREGLAQVRIDVIDSGQQENAADAPDTRSSKADTSAVSAVR